MQGEGTTNTSLLLPLELGATPIPVPSPLKRGKGTRTVHRSKSGFTLVEVMVVIVIIGLLATVVLINVLPAQDRAMVEKARVDVAQLESAVETYRLETLEFPASLGALVSAPAELKQPDRYREGGYIRRLPKDPWGADYQYAYPGTRGRYDIWSFGADGKPGGEGHDADIGNW